MFSDKKHLGEKPVLRSVQFTPAWPGRVMFTPGETWIGMPDLTEGMRGRRRRVRE